VIDETSTWQWTQKQNTQPMIVLEEDNVASKVGSIDQDIHVRRSSRTVQKQSRLNDYELLHDTDVTPEGDLAYSTLILMNFDEAATYANGWEAMEEEITSIKKNHTLDLVDPPCGKKPIALKWVYKVKVNPKGEIVRYKARLVMKGIL